ncbi:hypothetical protein QK910_12375 [Lactococcus cremoris]|uniref:hypothetical protein n=1 Tax=Lactococcus lactis subsp. cremoris TaxID=1359 RepID=UPI003A7FC3E8
MTKFEEELSVLPVSKSTNYTEYWNKAQLLTVFKDWQPQQALPVVPECVAEWIEHCKGMGYGLIAALTFKLSSTMHEELSLTIIFFKTIFL